MPSNKCIHGIYGGPSACATCKDWPSYERMKEKFPFLSQEMFLVMTPEQRLRAVRTGELQ